MTGRTISHFEVLEKLGEGGMGVVYKARDVNLGRLVALKVLPPDRVSDTSRRKRFIQEAKAASALNHPNIITVHEVFEFEGGDCICMELVDGKTLDQLIPRSGMRLSEALRVAVQICDALAKAHSAGIIHRDLKPANVMVSAEGRVKVLDFGLAKLTEQFASGVDGETATIGADASSMTKEGAIVGTVAYMSPEQAEGKSVDSRSDIFSFGSLLYEMVSGQRAFLGGSSMKTLAAVIEQEPRPILEVVPTLPIEIGRVISRCLRKDLSRRTQHMDDLKLALEDCKEESDSGVVASGARGPGKSLWPLLVAGILIALAAGAVWMIYRPAESSVSKIVAVTNFAGNERQPALSPDGKQVAFMWGGEDGANLDIYVKLVDAGAPVRLTTNPAADVQPSWSPDGRYIAFARMGEEGGYYIVPSLGGGERRLSGNAYDSTDRFQPAASVAWTSDGKFLIVPDYRKDPVCLSLVPAGGGEPKCLTAPLKPSFGDFLPSVSPDGKLIAFVRSTSSAVGEYFVASLSGQSVGNIRPIRKAEGILLSPAAWTSGSDELVISTNLGGQDTLIRQSIATGSEAHLIPGIGDGAFGASIARSGGRLAFSQGRETSNLWRMSLQANSGIAPQRLMATSRSDQQAELSPDGAKIVFASNRSGEYEIWVANADGSNPLQITFDLVRALRPRWSPDGRRIAFAARPGGNVDIYSVDASGGPARRLTTHVAEDASAQWSLDGRWIYFTSNRSGRREIWKMRSDGSEAEFQVTKDGGTICIEHQNGSSLVFSKQGVAGIFRMPVAGGTEEKISDASITAIAIVGDNLYFHPDRGKNIQRMDLVTKRVQDIVPADKSDLGGVFGFFVSRDGEWMVYARVEQSGSDIMLVDHFR